MNNFLVLHKYKLIFICIPKNANSSIKRAITLSLDQSFKNKKYNYKDIINIPEISIVNKEDIYNLIDKGYMIISILRNPYTRILSFWNDKILRKKISKDFTNIGIKPNMSFEETVKIVSNIDDDNINKHIKSQNWFLTYNNYFLPNNIIFFENLLEDWKKIKAKIKENSGLTISDLEYINKSKNKRNYNINPEIKELIYKRYKKDFELINFLSK